MNLVLGNITEENRAVLDKVFPLYCIEPTHGKSLFEVNHYINDMFTSGVIYDRTVTIWTNHPMVIEKIICQVDKVFHVEDGKIYHVYPNNLADQYSMNNNARHITHVDLIIRNWHFKDTDILVLD